MFNQLIRRGTVRALSTTAAVRFPLPLGAVEGSIVGDKDSAFARREHAQEELYFRKLQEERIAALRDLLNKEERVYKDHYCRQQLVEDPRFEDQCYYTRYCYADANGHGGNGCKVDESTKSESPAKKMTKE